MIKEGLIKMKKQRHSLGKTVFHWMVFALVIMSLSQGILFLNQRKIKWIDGRYTQVALSQSGKLIIAVNSETGLAGALNLEGEEVIPVENEVFDPWDGSLIHGLRQEGNLFWTIQDKKVGIVNEKNEEVIPRKYGYLKKTQEDQFIAGTGQVSNSVSSGGVYTYRKYGVIRENGEEVIPFEYDTLSMSEDGRYEGSIEEDTKTIIRTFYPSGAMQAEEIRFKEEDTDTALEAQPELEDTDTVSETHPDPEEEMIEESAVTEELDMEAREDSGIEEYDGAGTDYELVNYYVNGNSTKLHLSGNQCMLEDEYGNVLTHFEGKRVQDSMPEFTKENQLVIDQGEDFYRIYNASTGTLLCDVAKEANCIVTDQFVVFEQGTQYVVKNYKNTEIFRVAKGSEDKFLNAPNEKARFVFQRDYFVFQADTGRTLITNSGIVLAKNLGSISFNDENNNKENAEERIYICEKEGLYGAFNALGDKILDFQYKNIEFFNGHVNALRVQQKDKKVGIVDYRGKIIIPLVYDSVGYGNYIEEANNDRIEDYQLMNSKHDSYYGIQNSRIYYLDAEGNKTEEVPYVKATEQGRDLNDFLTLQKTMETPKEYRITGDLLIMDNAYSKRLGFGRSRIYEWIEQNKIQFLLVDESNSKIGTYEYYIGDFTLMGYQHWVWYIWMISSRIFLIMSLIWIGSKIPYKAMAKGIHSVGKGIKKQ